MEEIFVIKLKGMPSTSNSESSTSNSNDLLRKTIQGLGVLHLMMGSLSFLFGLLGIFLEYESSDTGAGIWCGVVFLTTGLVSVYPWRHYCQRCRIKTVFVFSLASTIMAAVFLVLCLIGVVKFHSVSREFGESAKFCANAIIAGFIELIVAVISAVTTANALWGCLGEYSLSSGQQIPKRVIVTTKITGVGVNGFIDSDVIRHISPNCVVSFRQPEELKEALKRVEEYVRESQIQSYGDGSFTCSELSIQEDQEQDLGVDSENWRNDVLSLRLSSPPPTSNYIECKIANNGQ